MSQSTCHRPAHADASSPPRAPGAAPVRRRDGDEGSAARLSVVAAGGFALAGFALLGGCRDAPRGLGSTAPGASLSRAWAVGAASAALSPAGRFALATGTPAEERVDAAQAAVLATAYLRTFGRHLQLGYAQDRGAAVAVDRLATCGPAYYVASPYLLGDAERASGHGKLVGGHWLVDMCDGEVPEVSVAVSGRANSVVLKGGWIVSQPTSDFYSVGIPVGHGRTVLAPEAAAAAAASATGRHVAGVPELVGAPFPYAPQLAKWRIPLDGAVTVRAGAGPGRPVTEVYYGYGRTWNSVALHAASASGVTEGPAQLAPLPGANAASPALRLTAAPGYAAALDVVEVVP